MSERLSVAILAAVLSLSARAEDLKPSDVYKLGHSHMGGAYDEGPRQRPRKIEGIGHSSLPITTKNPEVQQWFDQGVTLLHSFWYYEAERAFRWCLKLEPENAMAYWGMARATNGARSEDFIREAVKRKNNVTERERLYIEAIAAEGLPDPLHDKPSGADGEGRGRKYRKALETLCVKYPDDMEARSLLALASMGDNRYGAELMIREILSKQPDHPGAHHYRIHNWDYHEPEQAIVSAQRYGQIVPGIGHALHMPGHIFSIVGMWNEAAIAMDAATRAEKKYMKDSLTFPFNNWNYGHNRYYLSYIQEQLGMPDSAIFGVRQLIDAPQDPKDNNDGPFSSHSYGIAGLARALTRFERWDELLNEKTIPWRDIFRDKAGKAYFESRAHLGKRDLAKAEKSITAHLALKKDIEKNKDFQQIYGIQEVELKARLALLRGDTITGLGMLADASQREFEMQKTYADPPQYPESLYNALGEAYLENKSPLLAAKAWEKALELTKSDIFALSGLVRAYAALGEKAKAEDAMARLNFVAADAQAGLGIVELARATGVKATPRDASPAPQRNYPRTSLEKYGPQRWEPYGAPALEVRDTAGKPVTLDEFKGKNVMLVFYLGQECAHCMRQLHDLGKKKDDWSRLDTVLIAVSSQTPEKNAKAIKELGDLPWKLLSDDNHTNARRWHSFDDFEELELHSTLLIDKKGRVYWGRVGGDPFSDSAYIIKQLERMNAMVEKEAGVKTASSN